MELMLKDKEVYPHEEVLATVLKDHFTLYKQLVKTISGPDWGLSAAWKYYHDGKSWLCKVSYKKKTVCWLSVWDGFFKISFYFTEKNAGGIAALELSEKIRKRWAQSKRTGRLIPLLIEVDPTNLKDVLTLAAYKKSLK